MTDSALIGQTDAPPAAGKAAGDEPLPGYRLLGPLGRGGFGEVWECEAPGGLRKAIKFVADCPDPADGSATALRQEFDAVQRIKAARHPFLLTLERVELVGGELVMVMELADRQLEDVFAEYTAAGRPGVPRAELLSYLADAAEALDVIAAKHELQHLDVKPANIFLVGGRAKIGDFGLVGRVDPAGGLARGLTPRYVAPEVVRGRVTPQSDQYSLALVYFQLLTGRFPFPARTAAQILLQHATAAPDLSPLPEADRPAVGRALAKDPAARFPTCSAFVRAVLAAGGGSVLTEGRPGDAAGTPTVNVRSGGLTRTAVTGPPPTLRTNNLATAPTLRTAAQVAAARTVTDLVLPKRVAPPAPEPDAVELVALAPAGATTRLDKLAAVRPLPLSIALPPNAPAVGNLMDAVLRAAGHAGSARGDAPVRLPDGSWVVRFPLRQTAGVVPLKLSVLRDEWGAEIDEPEPGLVVVRRYANQGFWGRMSGKRAGLGVAVRLLDPTRLVGDAEVTGAVFGEAGPQLEAEADKTLPGMVDEVRGLLRNVDNRRAEVRVPVRFNVTLHPVDDHGWVYPPVVARCRDVSRGGLGCVAPEPIDTGYAYVEFPAGGAAGWAVLIKIVRNDPSPDGFLLAGRFPKAE